MGGMIVAGNSFTSLAASVPADDAAAPTRGTDPRGPHKHEWKTRTRHILLSLYPYNIITETREHRGPQGVRERLGEGIKAVAFHLGREGAHVGANGKYHRGFRNGETRWGWVGGGKQNDRTHSLQSPKEGLQGLHTTHADQSESNINFILPHIREKGRREDQEKPPTAKYLLCFAHNSWLLRVHFSSAPATGAKSRSQGRRVNGTPSLGFLPSTSCLWLPPVHSWVDGQTTSGGLSPSRPACTVC